MANPWFRAYSEFAHDPKVQMMTEALQRRLHMLMCLRCSNTLETLHETELAFFLRISNAELAETKATFVEKGFIDDRWNLVNWDKRQFSSDSSTERVRAYREKQKQANPEPETDTKRFSNGLEQIQNRTDTDTEQKQRSKTTPAAVAAVELPPWVDREAWSSYEEMRKKIRKPMTPRARELVLKKLSGFEARGLSSTESLNRSVVSAWVDVYEPKQHTGGSNGHAGKTELIAKGNADASRILRAMDHGLPFDGGGYEAGRTARGNG